MAHKHDVPLIVDNTVATPYLIQPLKLGADIVVHSSSKYINGSSDAISGILVCGKGLKWDPDRYPGLAPYRKFGPFAYIAKLRNGLFRNTGACLAPQNAFLNNLGLETLGLRMQRQCDNALELARFLQGLGGDIEVNYPGLEESPLSRNCGKAVQEWLRSYRNRKNRKQGEGFFHYNSEDPADHLQYRRYEDPGDPSGIHHRGTHLRRREAAVRSIRGSDPYQCGN